MPAEAADDLLAFIDASPSPSHAVAELVRRLEAGGFRRLDEREPWSWYPGDQRFVVRDSGSLVAFRVGSQVPSSAGFRVIGAHTDSPAFKVRPLPDVRRAGYRLVGVETYGGPLLHTWLDRDLTLAGRVAVRGDDPKPEIRLVRLPGAPLRIPSLAIHLDRDLNTEGLRLNPQQHLVPLWGPDLEGEPGLIEVVAEIVGCAPEDVLGHDLVTADTLPAARGGAGERYLLAPRLDNLASCHAGCTALLAAAPMPVTQVMVANDHEEVGSGSAEGARGPFLGDVLQRIVTVTEEPQRGALAANHASVTQAAAMAMARSWLVSADMAHAVHPNYSERHEPLHAPRLGGGPVLKVNANQSYATDAGTGAWFTARCQDAGVPLQHFVTRGDLPCGSTIGPVTATRLGIPTVDVGSPMLSMHSCRELAAAADVAPMIAALTAHLTAPN